jgi:glycosyltransferase involved in cell wall biosynthesis
MKIALALEYPLVQQGGTEVLVGELLRGLSPHFELVLVSNDAGPANLPAEMAKLISRHARWDPQAATAATSRALAASLRTQQIALAHFHLGGTYEWQSNRFWRCPIYHLAKLGVPCLTTNHLAVEWLNCGCDPARPKWQKRIFLAAAWLNRALVYRQLRFEVAVSQHDQARLIAQFPSFRHKIIQRYHSLLAADAQPPSLTGREPLVLCVGTIGGRKAQPLLVEAFARIAGLHPQWRLELVGRAGWPEDVQRIKDCIARNRLQERILLSGRLTDDETLFRMQRASIIAMPSLQEGLGLSLQEALFHGCVGLGTRAGGIPELIEHEVNGLLVSPGDVEALSAALDRLLSDPGLVDKLRTQTRLSILRKGMTSAAMVQNYLDLYRKLFPPQPSA